jgi:hypothetical protein
VGSNVVHDGSREAAPSCAANGLGLLRLGLDEPRVQGERDLVVVRGRALRLRLGLRLRLFVVEFVGCGDGDVRAPLNRRVDLGIEAVVASVSFLGNLFLLIRGELLALFLVLRELIALLALLALSKLGTLLLFLLDLGFNRRQRHRPNLNAALSHTMLDTRHVPLVVHLVLCKVAIVFCLFLDRNVPVRRGACDCDVRVELFGGRG